MNALLQRLSYKHQIVVDVIQDDSHHPLLNTVRLGAVGRGKYFETRLKNISDIAPVDIVFNEGRFGYLDYSHHVSFTELVIISIR